MKTRNILRSLVTASMAILLTTPALFAEFAEFLEFDQSDQTYVGGGKIVPKVPKMNTEAACILKYGPKVASTCGVETEGGGLRLGAGDKFGQSIHDHWQQQNVQEVSCNACLWAAHDYALKCSEYGDLRADILAAIMACVFEEFYP